MHHQDTNSFSDRGKIRKRGKKSWLAKSLLTVSIGTGIITGQTLSGLATPVTVEGSGEVNGSQLESVESKLESKVTSERIREVNGVYLYGQSSEPEQLGQVYTVLEVRDRSVIGVFYMPMSSFDCYYGNLQSDRLAVTIVNSYDQTSYPYSIALERDSLIASDRPVIEQMGLAGFYPIALVSEKDQRILGICKQNYQDIVSY